MQISSVLPEPVSAEPLPPPRKPLRVAMLVSGDTLPAWAAALAVKLQNSNWAAPLLCATPSVTGLRQSPGGDAAQPVDMRMLNAVRTPLRQTRADLLLLPASDAATVRQLTPSYPAGIWWCEHIASKWIQSCRLRVLLPGRREAITAFESHSLRSPSAHWAQNLILERQLRLYHEVGNHTLRPFRSPLPPPQQTASMGLGGVAQAPESAIEYQGRWWKFRCVEAPLYGAPNRDLHVFYSSAPHGREWTSHPLNPVISDIRCAVTTGNVYERDGELYRPTALQPQRIVKLTEDDYEEEAAGSAA